MKKTKMLLTAFAVCASVLMLTTPTMASIRPRPTTDDPIIEKDAGCSLCADDASLDISAIEQELEDLENDGLLSQKIYPKVKIALDKADSLESFASVILEGFMEFKNDGLLSEELSTEVTMAASQAYPLFRCGFAAIMIMSWIGYAMFVNDLTGELPDMPDWYHDLMDWFDENCMGSDGLTLSQSSSPISPISS